MRSGRSTTPRPLNAQSPQLRTPSEAVKGRSNANRNTFVTAARTAAPHTGHGRAKMVSYCSAKTRFMSRGTPSSRSYSGTREASRPSRSITMASAMDLRAGIDVGGTFTDVVARDASGALTSCKVPTTTSRPAAGVLQGLAHLTGGGRVATSLAHGTTIVTNAIVEKRTAAVGLVTTRGFRDVLEIARQNRTHLYRLDAPAKPEPLVPRHLRLEVSERVGPDGAVLVPLALAEVEPVVAQLKSRGVESVAICLLHAYGNPAHEHALRLALEPHFCHLSVSSEINAEFREYERTCTTVLNAAVMPLATRYLDDLVARLDAGHAGRSLHLLHSAGGMMSV